ncbi:MAG: diacylglycerol/lipid kinase family protein [Bacteroidota bacterium]
MSKERILFIVNPTSGSHPSRFKSNLLKKLLDSDRYEYKVHTTTKAGNGYHTVKKRLDDFDGFVAVGGDGTVNEVFKAILGTKKWFSVIPNGSGNGLARTLGIPMNTEKAIKHLNKAFIRKIDYGILNGEPFINVAGIGFDARIANKFKKSTKRGLQSYVKIAIDEYHKFKSRKVKIQVDGKSYKRRLLLASFANSSQFGNNAHIAPKARLNDGKIHIITFKKFHWFSVPYLAWLLFNRGLDKSKLHKEYIVDKAVITSKKSIDLHIDGEAAGKVRKIELKAVPEGVKVMA